tara:strand:+ start:32 stop:373 length:342 start_codon:yes stop_codon:yes gene_type:complete
MTKEQVLNTKVQIGEDINSPESISLRDLLNWNEINTDSQFMNDLQTHKGIYNLIVTKRDINLYVKLDMKPNRFWKITDVKKYFGIKGKKQSILEKIELLCEIFAPRNEQTTNA